MSSSNPSIGGAAGLAAALAAKAAGTAGATSANSQTEQAAMPTIPAQTGANQIHGYQLSYGATSYVFRNGEVATSKNGVLTAIKEIHAAEVSACVRNGTFRPITSLEELKRITEYASNIRYQGLL